MNGASFMQRELLRQSELVGMNKFATKIRCGYGCAAHDDFWYSSMRKGPYARSHISE